MMRRPLFLRLPVRFADASFLSAMNVIFSWKPLAFNALSYKGAVV